MEAVSLGSSVRMVSSGVLDAFSHVSAWSSLRTVLCPGPSVYWSVRLEHSLCGRKQLEKMNRNDTGGEQGCGLVLSSMLSSETNNTVYIRARAAIKSFINVASFSLL